MQTAAEAFKSIFSRRGPHSSSDPEFHIGAFNADRNEIHQTPPNYALRRPFPTLSVIKAKIERQRNTNIDQGRPMGACTGFDHATFERKSVCRSPGFQYMYFGAEKEALAYAYRAVNWNAHLKVDQSIRAFISKFSYRSHVFIRVMRIVVIVFILPKHCK